MEFASFTAFADKLVLEAFFSIALGFQPKVRTPKIARRGATFCGSFMGNRATLTDTRQMAKTQFVQKEFWRIPLPFGKGILANPTTAFILKPVMNLLRRVADLNAVPINECRLAIND